MADDTYAKIDGPSNAWANASVDDILKDAREVLEEAMCLREETPEVRLVSPAEYLAWLNYVCRPKPPIAR